MDTCAVDWSILVSQKLNSRTIENESPATMTWLEEKKKQIQRQPAIFVQIILLLLSRSKIEISTRSAALHFTHVKRIGKKEKSKGGRIRWSKETFEQGRGWTKAKLTETFIK